MVKEQGNCKRKQAQRTFVNGGQQSEYTEKSGTSSRFTYISSTKRTTQDANSDDNNTTSDARKSRVFVENNATPQAPTELSAAESSSIQERNQSTVTIQNDVQKSAQNDSQMNTGETKAEEQANARNTEKGAQPSDSQQSDATQSNIWHRIAGGLRTAGHGIAWVWNKRIKLPYTLYAVVFLLVTLVLTLAMQWSVMSEPTYAPDADVDDYTKAVQSVVGQLTSFVSDVWLRNDWTFVLNFLVIGLIYFVVVSLLNRFWVATAIVGTVLFAFSVANYCKVQLRNEPILPADLSFVSGGNTGEIVSFIPPDQIPLVHGALTTLLWFAGICVAMQFLDKRNGLIPVTYRPSRFVSAKNFAAVITRWAAFLASFALLLSFSWNLSVPQSWSQNFAAKFSDKPQPFSAISDAKFNGPAINFLRLSHVKVMDKPTGYSKNTMQLLAQKYASDAQEINATRTQNLTDSTVIMILSESFSDPNRVPGIQLPLDPIPNIRSVERATTSGAALTPGYGGGTANIEYQSLTGLNLANFDPSIISVYQQLVGQQKKAFSFNQMWTSRWGHEASSGFHPYYSSMYLRRRVYQTFGFSRFTTLDSNPPFAPQDFVNSSEHISDESSYAAVLDQLRNNTKPQFIQLTTMQNHNPYKAASPDNEFLPFLKSTGISNTEQSNIATYCKDLQYTDTATAEFLEQLNQIDRPITIIFYGDHLPGIYTTASQDENNTLALHEADYFIWSNQASASADTKLTPQTSAYSSSNFFMDAAAEHMNAQVSPYLALLTNLRHSITAISRIGGTTDWGTGEATFLNTDGNTIPVNTLTSEQQKLWNDYKLVQYDITVGEGYLYDTQFFDLKH